jgi:acetyl-CoA acetyltransferase family protein
MKDVYIAYAKRTPIGKFQGMLSSLRVDDMLAQVMTHFKNQNLFDLNELDDIIVGCANQAGEDNRNLGRMSALLAGFPFAVPATTTNRLCGSSLDATISAFTRIGSGMDEAILVGGAESMTRAPFVLAKASEAFARSQEIFDTSLGWRFPNPKMKEMFPLYSMGETAEEVAAQFKITRERQDKWAFDSHQKASKAQADNKFKEEIVSIPLEGKKGNTVLDTDECPRADSTLQKLATLKPAFRKDGSVTAGNAASLNDGAALLLVCSAEFLKRHNLKPLLKITGAGVRGLHPNIMGAGPIEAVKTLCKKFNKKPTDFDVVELNEAFAAQVLASIDGLDLDQSKVNLNGGSIALGHPLGCSGARIITTLAHIMKNNKNLKQGLTTMCIGVGQGIAVSFENC